MTAERFRQIRNVFDAAVERDQSEQAAFLAEACQGDAELRRQVEQLLLNRNEPSPWLDSAAETDERFEGRRIGHYEILRSLGEGGMGAVYLAARADGAFRKLVAIKIVRPESATAEVLRRFQQEREILASLEHPNIARILDGGETPDGLPYLVMEYVEGKPIHVYCDEHCLTVKERIELFDQVCSTVQYAHTKHVIHRDLKPSNVLITAAGEVKLLDFGIAKVLASEGDTTLLRTRSDLRLMTPEYASPEQVRGENVTASSDIYALGVLLYELLTGRRPYRLRSRIFHEVVRVICEEPPTRPSTVVTERDCGDDRERMPEDLSRRRGVSPRDLRRELAGNLDAVLLKTLEKDQLERYRSVAELRNDLQKHLSGESVRASRVRGLHALGTLVQRYPWGAVAALALAVVCLNSSRTVVAAILANLAVLAATLAFSSWVARRDYGPSLARSLVEVGLKRMAFIGLMVFAFYSLVKKLSRPSFDTTMEVLWAVTTIAMTYGLLRWSLRKKILGPLLLDLSRRRNWFVVALATVAAGAAAVDLSVTIKNAIRPDFEQPLVYFHIGNRPDGSFQSGYGDTSLPITAYATLSEQSDVFSTVIAFAPLFTPSPDGGASHSNSQPGVPIWFRAQYGEARGDEVSENFFSDLHVPIYLGRGLTLRDQMRNARVAVLSYEWWNSRFASQPTVLGQVLYVKGVPFTIIGVTAPGFRGVDPYTVTDFWILLQTNPRLNPWGMRLAGGDNLYTAPQWYCLMLLGRLRAGITQQQALVKLRLASERANSTNAVPSFDPRKYGLYFSPASAVGDPGQALAHQKRARYLRDSVLRFSWMMLFAVNAWFSLHRVELRKHGLAINGSFIRWSRIGAYSWEPKEGEYEVLRVRLGGRWRRWSKIPVYVLVKRNLQQRVDDLLKQQFGEWPT